MAHFHAFAPVADLYIVTTERSVRSPLAYARNLMGGEEFSRELMKYITCMSVDDYAKPRTFANDVGYKAMNKPEFRTQTQSYNYLLFFINISLNIRVHKL